MNSHLWLFVACAMMTMPRFWIRRITLVVTHVLLAGLTGMAFGIIAARAHGYLMPPPYAAIAGTFLLYPFIASLLGKWRKIKDCALLTTTIHLPVISINSLTSHLG